MAALWSDLGWADKTILGLAFVAAIVYLFRGSWPLSIVFGGGGVLKDSAVEKKLVAAATGNGNGHAGGGDERNFVETMKRTGKRLVIFYGSQTGTAEEYAIRIAREAKARFGLSSIVLDPDDVDFEHLDQVPEGSLVAFVVATYGEGEPTDNTVSLWEYLKDEDVAFGQGNRLEGLQYIVFGLGNRTYEQFNQMARNLDSRLESLGAKRLGSRGEGDDDKSMEEDYLAWKDGMWEDVSQALGVEEGAGGDTADFEVREVGDEISDKVYLGELSGHTLRGTKAVHDAKNPYPAPIVATRELFKSGDRNCVHLEFDIKGSGMSYQHGDHVALWPPNPDAAVDRLLSVLGLSAKGDTILEIKSNDPALSKVPFPQPTTYRSIFRYYLDVSSPVGRQLLASLAKFAPSEQMRTEVARLGSDKAYYEKVIRGPCLTLSETLQKYRGNADHWEIPFDRIISGLPRLTPRFYSISSSPKMYPETIHVTAIVLKYQPIPDKWVYGVGTNYLLHLKEAVSKKSTKDMPHGLAGLPYYVLEGPRSRYCNETEEGLQLRAPIHIRRSTFRLPTNPKTPVILIGPGTGVAPLRGMVQERVAQAQKLKKAGKSITDWGEIHLFNGSRTEDDYLYPEEWKIYEELLDGKLQVHAAFSRANPARKIYVQDLIAESGTTLAELLTTTAAPRGSVYICGDGGKMVRDVHKVFAQILGESLRGSTVDGEAFIKEMKNKGKWLEDVWS